MSSTYSSSLRIELIGSGDQAGAWGATTDSNLSYVLDTAIAGYQAITVSSTDQVLTYVNGPTASPSLNQSVYASLKFNRAAAASNIYAPPASKQYIVWNNTSYALTFYNSTVIGNTTAAGVGVEVPAGEIMTIWSNGTSFYQQNTALVSPHLSGTPTAPTASAGTNTTQIATTAFVAASYAPLASPTFTGSPSLPTGTVAVTQSSTDNDTSVATTAFVQAVVRALHPVGSIYSATVATNPATLFGFGTWTQFAAGRMMMGAGGSFSPGTTGGSNDAITVAHTHTYSGTTGAMNSNASHSHSTVLNYYSPDAAAGTFSRGGSANFTSSNGTNATNIDHTHSYSGTTASAGSSGTNANLPPYIVVYMWQRTA